MQRTFDQFRWQLADDFVPRLEAVLAAPAHVVKESAAKLVTRHEVAGRAYYVKRYRHGAFLLRPLKFFFKPSQAAEEWRLAAEFEQRGVPIVRHVALGERWSARGLVESVLITEAFDDGVPLTEQHRAHFPRVVEFVESIARAGVTHLDFHPSNLLLDERNGALRLLDLHGAKVDDADKADDLRDVMLVQLAGVLPLPVSDAVARMARAWRRNAFARRSRRCLKSNRDFTRQRFGERAWQIRRGAIAPEVEAVLRNPDDFIARSKTLKAGRSSTVAAAHGLVLKRYNFKKPFNAVKDLFRGSRARRGFQKSYHLELCGYPTPRVLATADVRVCGLPIRSYLLMQEIPRAVDAGQWTGDAAGQLGSMLARLHEEGFTHRDLKETNILFDAHGAPWLIDLDGLSFVRTVSDADAAANLRRFAEGMSTAGKLTRRNAIVFLLRYCRVRGIRPRVLFPRHERRPR